MLKFTKIVSGRVQIIFFKIFILMWSIFKVFIDFATILLLILSFVFVFFFDQKACRVLAPQPGVEGEVLNH